MIEPKEAKIKIKTDGSYDGMVNVELPVVVDGFIYTINCEPYGLVDVPVKNLVAVGYNVELGLNCNPVDYDEAEESLTFIVGNECEVLNESV